MRKIQLMLGIKALHAPNPFIMRLRTAKNFKKRHISRISIDHPNTTQNVSHAFDAWIVGSDQVWRGSYVNSINTLPFFFLDFLPAHIRNRCIAYAASFGLDIWEGTQEETTECRRLLQQFKAVSVREHSGIDICNHQFGVKAVQMPDPTLLLERQDYEKIINSKRTRKPKQAYVAAYILDGSTQTTKVIDEAAEYLGKTVQHLMPQATAKNWHDRLPCSVAQWLRYIRDSDYIITDSFHGCVFSIIYNKPFICVGNRSRGMARFHSLFGAFHLESRFVELGGSIINALISPIDWNEINAIHDKEKERGIQFLKNNLQ